MTHPFVTTLTPGQVDTLRKVLEEQDFSFSTPQYTIFSAKKKGISVTLYQSLKLTVQGKESKEFIEFYLEPQILQSFQYTHPAAGVDMTPRIGVDEAGKGDFFGPLCIAALYAGGTEIEKLIHMGVKDSKMLGDSKIEKLGKELREQFQNEVIQIYPLRYNELYKEFGNLNSLLAWGHATAIEKLATKTGCPSVLIDKFAHEQVVLKAVSRKNLAINLVQKVRAEEDVVVAAASILARYAFLDGMKKLSKKCGIELPKGASEKVITTGKELVRLQGSEILPKVGKMHFKTAQVILSTG